MNPYEGPLTPYEQTLRDEVIYLHSLWHQGPPTLNPNPYQPTDVNYSSRNLHVSNPTPFKKTNRHKPTYQKANNVAPAGSAYDPRPDPGPEWLLNSPQPSPPTSGSGWLEFRSNLRPSSCPVSESDQGKVSAMHMQQKAVKCCNQFVVKRIDLDGNGDNELDEADGDDDCSWNDSVVEESEEFKFFLSFFVENQEMRDFYEKNTERGDFYCLVCRGKGEKVGKSYRGCASLLQHARTIWKKKRHGPHRAFGHLICKVLGWDISRLPMIVLKGEPLSHLLANSGQTEQGNGSEWIDSDCGVTSMKARGDGKKVLEDLSDEVANMEAKKEGATDCLEMPCKNLSHHQASQKPVDESPSTMVGWPASKPHCSSEASDEELERKKKAHRAYGQVICKVLGWDVDQLSTIVLKGEPLRQSMAKSGILAGEPEINADCGHEGAIFPQTETVLGNVSVSASREDSVNHHKSCVRNSSKGGIVNQHVKDLEKGHIKANKLRVLDSKVNLKESGGNYKKQNIAFWVNYCCWPETKLSESTKKANSRRWPRKRIQLQKKKNDFVMKSYFLQGQNTDGRDRSVGALPSE
ncbi:hypothetical protein SADUNF_Sadunf16G0256700 [Salix dunnii]|uniref:XS domain-containing protein n=1 Tax=Salix dunnii TaxID=1413687 RepID=A0A835JC26_9ROSI|nr:hypothetical protein SADUNF_Sadunf16G0256700 [Salix dunnii]